MHVHACTGVGLCGLVNWVAVPDSALHRFTRAHCFVWRGLTPWHHTHGQDKGEFLLPVALPFARGGAITLCLCC